MKLLHRLMSAVRKIGIYAIITCAGLITATHADELIYPINPVESLGESTAKKIREACLTDFRTIHGKAGQIVQARNLNLSRADTVTGLLKQNSGTEFEFRLSIDGIAGQLDSKNWEGTREKWQARFDNSEFYLIVPEDQSLTPEITGDVCLVDPVTTVSSDPKIQADFENSSLVIDGLVPSMLSRLLVFWENALPSNPQTKRELKRFSELVTPVPGRQPSSRSKTLEKNETPKHGNTRGSSVPKSQFIRVTLPNGSSLEIPGTWNIVETDSTLLSDSEEAFRKRAQAQSPSQHGNASQTLHMSYTQDRDERGQQRYYSSIRVTFAKGAEPFVMSPAILKTFCDEKRKSLAVARKIVSEDIPTTAPTCSKQTLNGHPTILTEYERTIIGMQRLVKEYSFFADDGMYTLMLVSTRGYDILLDPILQHAAESFVDSPTI